MREWFLAIIKTSRQIKVKTNKSDQKEICREQRDLQEYIKFVGNKIRTLELQSFKA